MRIPLIFPLLILSASFRLHALPDGIEFRAEHYDRNLRTKIEKGRGKAWLRKLDREMWAEELEIDSENNKAVAIGNVHLKEKTIEAYANKLTYQFDGEEAVLEDATVLSGQMVISGAIIRRIGKDHYIIEEGFYTNCNTLPVNDKSAANCLFDWKIYGRKFDLTVEGYVYVHDAIIYSKDLPLAYIPFYTAPAKSKRQTGLLYGALTNSDHLGSGQSLPFFWVLAPWQDLTVTPTLYSKAGFHLGLDYNYSYARNRTGGVKLYSTTRVFNAVRSNPETIKVPSTIDPNNPSFLSKPKTFGIIGEWAIDLKNIYDFDNGVRTKQQLSYVSDPYYPLDYLNDVGVSRTNLAYLRSQATAAYSTENSLYYGGLIHFQPLVISRDSPPTTRPELGADRGAVTQLPKIGFSQKSTQVLGKILSLEFDSNFNNYWRPREGFDNNVIPAGSTTINPNAGYQSGDFIREGRRLQLEPKLVANLPVASGFQLQPTLKATESLYHFDIPNSTTAHREFVSAEIPISMYLTKTFKPDLDDFEFISHLFQPRIIYGTSIYRSAKPTHDFFRTTNPPFDSSDLVTDFEFFRIELINRFRRQKNDKSTNRFLTFQLSNQYNSRLDRADPRFFDPSFKNRLGPLEVLVDIDIAPITARVQGYYQWEKTNGRHENAWTTTFTYSILGGDSLSLTSLVRNASDPAQDEQLITMGAVKVLPIFVDLMANASYSAKRGEFRGYEWGAKFASKPSSCWDLTVVSGQTQAKQNYARFVFQMRFGGPLGFAM